jgi:hypothetical protein
MSVSTGKPMDILIFNSVGNNGVPSFLDHIGMFARHSRHRFFYHNFVYKFDPEMDFSKFDVVVFTHNFWLPALSPEQVKAIKKIKALKVLFLQDEFQYLRHFNAMMAKMGINLMFTCAAERDFDAFYPKKKIPSLREVHQNLTGYVSDSLRQPGMRARGSRKWDVGYRGRPPIYYMGLMGQHKIRIAHEMTQLCEREGLSHNISYLEDDRLVGDDWLNFLRSTRVQLGSPSGTSIVDLNGKLIEAEHKYRVENPHATFDDVYKKILARYEGKMKIDTVSPRHFEYAATGATMAMVEGEYGGYLTAGEHYIPIAPDYSNLDEVAAQIKDRKLCSDIADRAHDHLIASNEFRAEKFVERFDTIIEQHAEPVDRSEPANMDAFNAMMTERFNQVLFFTPQGHHHTKDGEGQRLRREALKSATLLRTPIIGALLRRTGGEPLTKFAKGRAAMRLALAIPAYRRLIDIWLRNPEYRADNRILTADMLKSVLLLGLVKAAQSGAAPYGEGFHVDIGIDADAITLTGVPVDSGIARTVPAGDKGLRKMGWSKKIENAVVSGAPIQLDLSRRWPINLFGHSTQFTWSVDDKVALFRSESDEYFHLSALTKVAAFAPECVLDALKASLLPARGEAVGALNKAFNITLPETADCETASA